jgi:phosphoribosylformylglycinamidine cyclo-ligase
VVDRQKIIDGRNILPGDALIGLASTGLHSNGFSLARRVLFDDAGLTVSSRVDDLTHSIGETLLIPTRIYVRTILKLISAHRIKGMAHITGGGITENLPRVFPQGRLGRIRRAAWTVPPIFPLIQRLGRVEDQEMYRVFNMGIGLILVVPAEEADGVVLSASKEGETAWIIGEVAAGASSERRVDYVG